MAKMLPARPRTFAKGSLEDLMFEALEKKLPHDYYVIHSFKLITVKDETIFESETDFIVYHPEKGIICLEAKAGHVQCIEGDWYYASGKKMSHDGPYNQASSNKWKLKDYIQNSPYDFLLKKCKLFHAVWFPSVTDEEVRSRVLPPEADRKVTLTRSALENPLAKIEEIFSLDLPNNVQTLLSDKERDILLRKILCPACDLVPAISIEHDLKKQVFHRMLSEQKCVLDFLIEQKTAVIQGIAGTGKTLIALEKARRHAERGEKVLFLCYNRFLHDYIATNNAHQYIDYYTIDGFACRMCNTSEADYALLKECLENHYLEGTFPYQHIVIDEGQDFGQYFIEENEIIQLLENIITDQEDYNGSFYVFYDAMQLVQGQKIPEYITQADCKLTLYKNCRNTENIATTSMKPIRNKKPKLIDGCIKGTVPRMYYLDKEEQNQKVLDVIKLYEESGLKDIVVLTCKTEATSSMSGNVKNGKVNGKYKFTTCRKFKGLEADAIIITDIDFKTLTTEATKVFYVGASRARLFLSLMCQLDEDECSNVLVSYGIQPKVKRVKKQLTTALNTILAQ